MARPTAKNQCPPTDGTGEAQRRRSTAALSRLLNRLLAPAARRRGFAAVEVLEQWPRIVGQHLARRCHPVRLDFRRGSTTAGTLVLQAGGGAALELQHCAPQIIERVNDYFGFPAVGRLRLVQLPLHPAPRPPAPPPLRPLSPAEQAALAEEVAAVGDAGLGAALEALGRSIKARQPRR